MCTMADDRGLVMTESHYTNLTCGSENASPYSGSTGFSEAPSYYLPHEYDWRQQQQQHTQQHAILQPTHQQMLDPSEKHFFNSYQDGPAQGVETNAHGCFSAFSHPPHPDFYSPASHGLWPAAPVATVPGTPGTDALAAAQMGQHHRFFSGIDLSQHPGQHHMHPHPHQSGTGTPGAGTPVVKPKRKRVQSHTQRKAANVRERRRMFHLNEAFDELRKRLPAFNYEKRLSRIETLRLAMTYISFMKDVSVGEDPKSVKLKPHGAELSPLGGSSLLSSFFSGSGSSNDERSIINDDSDDEISNHSGGN